MGLKYLKINTNTYKLGEDEIPVGYYRVYPTLSAPPTTTTRTCTINSETVTYEIGALVRVTDASSPVGYSFYRLYDITNNNLFIWSKEPLGLFLNYERVIIPVRTNQSTTDDIIGAYIGTSRGHSVYNGETYILKYVPVGLTYTILADGVDGYTCYTTSTTYTAQSWGNTNVVVEYCTEVVSVDGDNLYDFTIYQDDGITNSAFSMESIKVPYEITYVVEASTLDGREYRLKEFTAEYPDRLVNFSNEEIDYDEYDPGIYIVKWDKTLVAPSNWNTSNNASAVGVALVTSNCRFFIAKGDPKISPVNFLDSRHSYAFDLQEGGDGENYNSGMNIVDPYDSSSYLSDYNGKLNTRCIETYAAYQYDWNADTKDLDFLHEIPFLTALRLTDDSYSPLSFSNLSPEDSNISDFVYYAVNPLGKRRAHLATCINNMAGDYEMVNESFYNHDNDPYILSAGELNQLYQYRNAFESAYSLITGLNFGLNFSSYDYLTSTVTEEGSFMARTYAGWRGKSIGALNHPCTLRAYKL